MVQLYLGTQGWSYPSWVGSFYPSGTSTSEYLPEYTKSFNTVELDTTFYGVPRQSTIAGWLERTPAGFRFAAKFPKTITHEKALRDAVPETTYFVEAMAGLDDKLGPLLLQMPPQWTASGMDDLKRFLPDLPVPCKVARNGEYPRKASSRQVVVICGAHRPSVRVPGMCNRHGRPGPADE